MADHGEVFTNPREVNAMLDLVRDESFRLDSRFLEPACGDGNFLIEILRRKLSLLNDTKSQTEWEFKSLIAVGSCYGIDTLPDNAEACRTRLEAFVLAQHPDEERLSTRCATTRRGSADCMVITAPDGTSHVSDMLQPHPASERLNACSAGNTIQAKRSVVENNPYQLSLRYMLQKNIVCGDALTYRSAEDKPIVFCEWTPIAGSMQFSRRDFQFDFLVTQSHQYSLFDEQGEAQSFDEPVRTYPPLHYTQLYRYDI